MPSSRQTLTCQISQSLWSAIEQQLQNSGESLSHFVESALANELELSQHSLFQVSTSRALVEGVLGGCITVEHLKHHGDFGLGTFDQLDGEMILLDGHCYQAVEEGKVHEIDDTATVPFATVTYFSADSTHTLAAVDSLADLKQQLDACKPSGNLFAGFRIEGTFRSLSLRATCKAQPHEKLVEAIERQSTFTLENITGTLVGFWAPSYSSAVSVPGYHFHFIDSSRKLGGHVFDITADTLQAKIHLENAIHVALPETREFLEADLRQDGNEQLKAVETGE